MQKQMETIDAIAPAAQGSGFGGSVRRGVRGAVSLLLTWQQRARERRTLAAMDDYILRDLGLSRADVMSEIGKPFWRP